ncbi:hypothetical protein BDB00DRAFT_879752 [Zychaea mexicana]|uniref:uncharacterized protein n=1 Tax=Zychaea mexicana TaxID=64656 RepID=UPI0022FF2FD8|nr:uncharacterized protein BDB00DRAFT_879752 [Zychaea mexicana]KAI9473374.1 hypothetical protein BDB00DRAFT_879752 [Zychaea mexicana]
MSRQNLYRTLDSSLQNLHNMIHVGKKPMDRCAYLHFKSEADASKFFHAHQGDQLFGFLQVKIAPAQYSNGQSVQYKVPTESLSVDPPSPFSSSNEIPPPPDPPSTSSSSNEIPPPPDPPSTTSSSNEIPPPPDPPSTSSSSNEIPPPPLDPPSTSSSSNEIPPPPDPPSTSSSSNEIPPPPPDPPSTSSSSNEIPPPPDPPSTSSSSNEIPPPPDPPSTTSSSNEIPPPDPLSTSSSSNEIPPPDPPPTSTSSNEIPPPDPLPTSTSSNEIPPPPDPPSTSSMTPEVPPTHPPLTSSSNEIPSTPSSLSPIQTDVSVSAFISSTLVPLHKHRNGKEHDEDTSEDENIDDDSLTLNHLHNNVATSLKRLANDFSNLEKFYAEKRQKTISLAKQFETLQK